MLLSYENSLLWKPHYTSCWASLKNVDGILLLHYWLAWHIMGRVIFAVIYYGLRIICTHCLFQHWNSQIVALADHQTHVGSYGGPCIHTEGGPSIYCISISECNISLTRGFLRQKQLLTYQCCSLTHTSKLERKKSKGTFVPKKSLFCTLQQ